MNKKVLITSITGVISFVLLLLIKYSSLAGWLSVFTSLLSSYFGIWYLTSWLFKSLVLNKKEKIYLFIGTLFALISFALGRFGIMLIYWLPGVIIGIITIKFWEKVLNKTSNIVINPLNEKIIELEDLKNRQDNQEK